MKRQTKITRSSTPRNPAINTYLPESVTFSTLSEIITLEDIALALNAAIQECELKPNFPKYSLHTLIIFYHDLVEFEYGPKTVSLLKRTFQRKWAGTLSFKTHELLAALDSAIQEMTILRDQEPETIKIELLRDVRDHLIKTYLGEQSWELCESLVA